VLLERGLAAVTFDPAAESIPVTGLPAVRATRAFVDDTPAEDRGESDGQKYCSNGLDHGILRERAAT
jgi:hypothetical protein